MPVFSPKRIMAPFPKLRSIWSIAVCSAFFLSEAGVAASTADFFTATGLYTLSASSAAAIPADFIH